MTFSPRLLHHLRIVQARLDQAGLYDTLPLAFIKKQLFLAMSGFIVAVWLAFLWTNSVLLLTFPLLGWLLPARLLNLRISQRRRQILHQLPYYLDLITLALEAGLDFILALEEIVQDDRSSPLRDEFMMVLNSIRMGTPRRSAFDQMYQRTRLEELRLLASSIAQSQELGSSLGKILRLQAENLRRDIFRKAEIEAQRTPIKLLIPLIGLIFPVVFIILFAPIVMQLLAYR